MVPYSTRERVYSSAFPIERQCHSREKCVETDLRYRPGHRLPEVLNPKPLNPKPLDPKLLSP